MSLGPGTASTGPPKTELTSSREERDQLVRWARSAQAWRGVLACADGRSNKMIAEDLRVTHAIVGERRRRLVADWLDGLSDEPRPRRPPSVAADQVEDVVVTRLKEMPKNAAYFLAGEDGRTVHLEFLHGRAPRSPRRS
jgi:transposase